MGWESFTAFDRIEIVLHVVVGSRHEPLDFEVFECWKPPGVSQSTVDSTPERFVGFRKEVIEPLGKSKGKMGDGPGEELR